MSKVFAVKTPPGRPFTGPDVSSMLAELGVPSYFKSESLYCNDPEASGFHDSVTHFTSVCSENPAGTYISKASYFIAMTLKRRGFTIALPMSKVFAVKTPPGRPFTGPDVSSMLAELGVPSYFKSESLYCNDPEASGFHDSVTHFKSVYRENPAGTYMAKASYFIAMTLSDGVKHFESV